jgi:hypothetical protein
MLERPLDVNQSRAAFSRYLVRRSRNNLNQPRAGGTRIANCKPISNPGAPMRYSKLCLLTVAVLGTSVLHAQQQSADAVPRAVELSLSNKAGELRYRAPTSMGGRPDTEETYAIFLSEDRDIVGSAGLLFDTDLDLGPLHVRLGPQAYAALLNQENEDVFALAISGMVRYDLYKSRGIALVGSANWSPDITTFGTANNLTDMMARAEMRLSDRVIGFAGYRWFRLDLTDSDRKTLQNEVFAGIHWELR